MGLGGRTGGRGPPLNQEDEMAQPDSAPVTPADPGGVRVTVVVPRPGRWRTAGRYAVLGVVAVATAATVLFGYHVVLAATAGHAGAGPPATLIVDRQAARAVPGSARLAVSE